MRMSPLQKIPKLESPESKEIRQVGPSGKRPATGRGTNQYGDIIWYIIQRATKYRSREDTTNLVGEAITLEATERNHVYSKSCSWTPRQLGL